jgi:hypothetical protein
MGRAPKLLACAPVNDALTAHPSRDLDRGGRPVDPSGPGNR